ncbi:MAG: hypothetical protein JO033_28045 [Acidobacteriaceae bacterium]|nr:hypothetical protein [Acidobacteriaceae bacterium]MBV9482164.1 hypothetical protein [Acidobacteriota bacterium]
MRVKEAAAAVDRHVKDGRFQRSLAAVTAASSLVSGLEVTYEHYKGSFSNPVMYTPVILSGALTGAAVAGFFSRKAARRAMRWISAITLADGIIGFGFHVRGIQRKPGGWRIPLTNVIMGPPIFAPLLFGTAAYLGFMASYLRREEDEEVGTQNSKRQITDGDQQSKRSGWRQQLREGRFQRHLCLVTAAWTFFSGIEAWYSHYKSRFRIWAQWTPVILAPIQLAACIGGFYSERVANRVLPVTSTLAMVNGGVGFFYHARGIVRRPGHTRHWLYNILYGPPIFAPLLFSACGFLGALAGMLRRES